MKRRAGEVEEGKLKKEREKEEGTKKGRCLLRSSSYALTAIHLYILSLSLSLSLSLYAGSIHSLLC